MLRNLLIFLALLFLSAEVIGQSKAHLADSLYKAGEYARAQEEYEQLVSYWEKQGERDSSFYAAFKAAKCDIQLKKSETGRAKLQALLEENALPALLRAEAMMEIGHGWLDEFNIGEASTWAQKSLDFQHKLKITLPIIPTILKYERELSGDFFGEIKKWWQGKRWKEVFSKENEEFSEE